VARFDIFAFHLCGGRLDPSETKKFFSARCNIYISHLCYDVNVRLSVHMSVTEVHWCIIANFGFKFRSKFITHCGRSQQYARMHCEMRVHCGRGASSDQHRILTAAYREEGRGYLALC